MEKIFEWNQEKNQKLMKERGISFEAIVASLEEDGLLATIDGKGKYSHQKQLIVAVSQYVYIVPCVEDEIKIFLKTIIPSRKLTRHYLFGGPEGSGGKDEEI